MLGSQRQTAGKLYIHKHTSSSHQRHRIGSSVRRRSGCYQCEEAEWPLSVRVNMVQRHPHPRPDAALSSSRTAEKPAWRRALRPPYWLVYKRSLCQCRASLFVSTRLPYMPAQGLPRGQRKASLEASVRPPYRPAQGLSRGQCKASLYVSARPP